MSREKPLLASLLPLYVVIFIGFVGYSLMITIFTPMVMNNQGQILPASYSASQRILWLGILLSAYPLGQFFGSSVLGALSDRFGRRRLLLFTVFTAGLFYVLISIALARSLFSLLLAASALAGLLEANIALAQSAIADRTVKENRNKYFGFVYLSSSLAYVIGPLVGGKLAFWFDNAAPFWVATGLLFITFLWIFFAFKETAGKPVSKELHVFGALANLSRIFTSRHLRKMFLVNFLLYLAIFGFFRCYPMYIVDSFHVDVSKLSEFIAWVAVPIVVMNLGLTGFFSRHFSPKLLTIATAFLLGIFTIFIVVPPYLNALWITLFLAAFTIALCLPSCSSMLSLAASSEEQGSAMGNNQSLQVVAEAISSILGGLIAAVFVKLSLVVFGLVALAGGGLLLFFTQFSHGKSR